MLFKVVVSFWVGEGCQTVNKLNIKFAERSADFAQCPSVLGRCTGENWASACCWHCSVPWDCV